MKIFEYYDLYSLFYSFGSLNSRINNILYDCQVSVDFDQVKSIDFIDFISEILSKFNPKNIRSLHSSNQYQMGVLADDKSLIYFTHIRSLSLNHIKLNIIENIFSRIHFSRLEHILFDNSSHQSKINGWSCFKHLLDSNQCQFLRTYKNSCLVIKGMPYISFIECVAFLYRPNPCHFFNFLDQSPYLKCIELQFVLFDQYPTPEVLSSIPSQYNTLTHLNLELLNQVRMKTIIYLIQCVPQISHLKLMVRSNGDLELADPVFWEINLRKYLVKLKRLSLNVYVYNKDVSNNPIWNFLIDKKNVFTQIENSNYWSSHQWKTTFDSGMKTLQRNYYWAKFDAV
jgi:hypothetical protein